MSVPPKHSPAIVRLVLVIAGLLCVALGLLGIFLPLLPTTIFLILAAACFIRSSDRLHHWLIHHRIFGTYLLMAQGKSGMPRRAKICMLVLLWATILYSAFWFISLLWLRILLLTIALSVSVFILTRPSHAPANNPKNGYEDGACANRRNAICIPPRSD
jgi:uncharacterized membrane protein YbaN (DUF454 family)